MKNKKRARRIFYFSTHKKLFTLWFMACPVRVREKKKKTLFEDLGHHRTTFFFLFTSHTNISIFSEQRCSSHMSEKYSKSWRTCWRCLQCSWAGWRFSPLQSFSRIASNNSTKSKSWRRVRKLWNWLIRSVTGDGRMERLLKGMARS